MTPYERALTFWQAKPIDRPEDIDRELDSFRILFAYHSGKIENEDITYHDTREIFENGKVSGFTGSPRALFEQQNQKLCYEFLKPKIVAEEPLSLELIQEIHKILTGGTYDERRYLINNERPGEFKKHDYVTGIHEVGASAEDVPAFLSELISEVNDIGSKAPLKAAAYLHAVFENIHPFADGNGRVGRTLVNYFLMINHHPPLIVHEENRRGYYAALQRFDEAEELDPLAEFFREATAATWLKSMELAEGTQEQERKGLREFMQGNA